MCQKIEDCLLSKIGFRIFLSVVFSMIVFAFILNFQILTGSKESSAIHDNILRKIKEIRKDDRTLHEFSFKNEQKEKAENLNLHEKTKILIWSTTLNTDENSDTSFYTEFSHRVRKLRRNECPILKECIFASNKNKLQKADAIVFINDGLGNNTTDEVYTTAARKEYNLLERLHNLSNNNKLNIKTKIWSLLIRNPFDQRNVKNTTELITKKFGISHINYFISYMPDADIPLLQFSLTRKVLDKANSTFIDNNEMSANQPTLAGIIKRESDFTKLTDTEVSNAKSSIRTQESINVVNMKDSLSSNPYKYTKYEDYNSIKRRAYAMPIYSIFNNSKEFRSSKGKKYDYTPYRKFKKQILHLNEKRAIRVEPSTEQGNISTRRKGGKLNRRNVLNNKRLAAVIMNNCKTEGNREGTFLISIYKN